MQDIAILGYGAVAGYVARGLKGRANLAAVLARPGREAVAREVLGCNHVLSDADDLPDGLDCVLDCAGHPGIRAHGAAILRRGTDVITVSLGALADPELERDLHRAAQDGRARLTLASGAIGALDALSAAAAGGLNRVTYVGRKPPAGWMGSPAEHRLDLARLDSPAVHFEGSARACARDYPKNANVAAAVALAGLGLDDTSARLIADPTITRNIHQVEAEGVFGRFTFEIEGLGLPENPKSSALTGMSLLAAVDRRRAVIGF